MRIILLIILLLTNILAQTEVSGTVDGEVWSSINSPYNVVGDIVVNNLQIQENVIVKFTGEYVFEVTGTLIAIGTADKPIRFSKPYDVNGWQGIYFNFSKSESKLIHCLIEGSVNSGIIVDNCSPIIKNCIIQNNTTTLKGGGIFSNSDLTLDSCEIKNNRANGRVGGGIYSTAFLTMTNCTISGNKAWNNSSEWSFGGGVYSSGGLFMKHCTVESNTSDGGGGVAYKPGCAGGGGLFIENSNAVIENCIISSNSSNAYANTAAEVARGGGIYVSSGGVTLTNCIVCQNSLYSREHWSGSEAKGGGIYIASGSLTLTNSNIAFNGYEGIFQSGGVVSARNSIFYFNTRSQISGGQVNINYCDVEGGFSGENNISEDPIFSGDTGENICIAYNSPCVDKGDPNQVYNDLFFPPSHGTERNDIGAHGGPGAGGWLDTTSTDLHIGKQNPCLNNQFALKQNYPNPFNPTTSISYSLPVAGLVILELFNSLGQKVATLANEYKPAGTYEVIFDATQLASGVYMYRLTTDNGFSQTKKMFLIR